MGNTKSGIPISTRPQSVNGYFKCNISATDSFGIAVVVGKNRSDENGTGVKIFTGDIKEFTYFEFPINYKSSEDVDSLYLIIGNLAISNTGKIDLTIDDLSLSNDPVGGIIDKAVSLDVYPNPVNSTLRVNTLPNETLFSIYNLSGQLINSGTVNPNELNIIELSELHSGAYLLEIKGKNQSRRTRILKN